MPDVYNRILFICFLLFILVPLSVSARQTVINGTIGVGIDYWEREYDNDVNENGEMYDSDDGDKRQYGIWPEVTITSQGARDFLSFRYAPVFKYDDISDESDVDHYLNFDVERSFSSRWTVQVLDNFQRTDDPSFNSRSSSLNTVSTESSQEAEQVTENSSDVQQSTVSSSELSRDLGRRRYWSNDLQAKARYTINSESSVGGGYGFKVLRDDGTGESVNSYEDYDRHNLFADVEYRINQSWHSSVILDYVKGLYDDIVNPETEAFVSDDLDEYRATLRADYLYSGKSFFPFVYNFVGVKYDNDLQRDSWAHEFTVGWSHDFDARNHLAIGGGPTYVNGEGVEGEWDYNIYLDYKYNLARSSFSLFLEKKYDTRNFSGDRADSGFKDTYLARAAYNHFFTRDLFFDLFASYRWESNLDPQVEALGVSSENNEESTIGDLTYDKDIVECGVGLNYSFMKYFTTRFRYTYYLSDGDLNRDSYNDHRLLLTLSASTELWKW